MELELLDLCEQCVQAVAKNHFAVLERHAFAVDRERRRRHFFGRELAHELHRLAVELFDFIGIGKTARFTEALTSFDQGIPIEPSLEVVTEVVVVLEKTCHLVTSNSVSLPPASKSSARACSNDARSAAAGAR